ncbi:MAG: S1 RNA-binding domain-containing protein, partial [Nitrospirae bacterium]|nr:S1 RNA-binding domain-containing protein [Nitrospirota bacterium]
METQFKEETADIERLYAETVHRVRRGGVINGKVMDVKSDVVVVDVGYKSEGVIPISQFTHDELSVLKQGDRVDVFVEKINDQEGSVVLSRDRVSKLKTWEKLTDAHRKNETVMGRIVSATHGGLTVDISGTKAFLPLSHVDV